MCLTPVVPLIRLCHQGRRKLGIFDGDGGSNTPGGGPIEPDESETETCLGLLEVDFTDANGLPIYTDHADIEKEIDALNLLPGVAIAELNGEVKALGFPTNVEEGKEDRASRSLRGQFERYLAEDTPYGITMVSYLKATSDVLAGCKMQQL